MSTHTQADAEALAKRRRQRRSVTVEVHVSEYVDATVYLDKIRTDDLRAELREREQNGDVTNGQGDFDDGYQEFTLDRTELERIRHLFLIGRAVEASDACRVLLSDMLGTAI